MTLAELEARSAAARQRFHEGRVHLSEATRPPQLLRTGYALASKAASKVMPEATKHMSEHTGAALANMMVGASATFIATQISRMSTSSRPAAEPASAQRVSRPDRPYSEPATPRRPVRQRGASWLKSAAVAGAGWYVGSLLSRTVKPTTLEQHMVERYGRRFTDWLATARRDGPSFVVRASGLGDKASAVLIMLSAAATLIAKAGPQPQCSTPGHRS